jgi:hypothetical protein
MKVCGKRRITEVPAGKTWRASLENRIYSCPDTPVYDRVLGATGLILTDNRVGKRVFLDVEAMEICNPNTSSFLDAVSENIRYRLKAYTDAVKGIRGIVDGQSNYRFYFLSDEPWPNWLQELAARNLDTEWTAVLSLLASPSDLIEWPKIGTLLWPGCVRGGASQDHTYPPELKRRLTGLGITPDLRNNGPAISAFLAAGGIRPTCGREGWPVHHIYDGTGMVTGGPQEVIHAVKDGQHFTHSGGLVALHPVVHHLAHQSDLLKWVLRREAFLRFGYDPMNAFGKS